MKSVFLLQHLHVVSDNNECTKIIGLYETRDKAREAVTRLSTLPGFSDHPNIIDAPVDGEGSGFYIDEYELGKDHWCEGYVTD